MPQIFGQEIKGKTLWIVLGVIAAGVAVVVYVRSKAAPVDTGAAIPADNTGDMGGGGGGGGYAVPVQAPTDAAADAYNAQLRQVQLDAAKFGLDQQKAEEKRAQTAFDLNATLTKAYNDMQMAIFGQETQVGASQAETAKQAAELATSQLKQTTAEVQSGKIKGECGKGESSAYDRNTGEFFCKKSGQSGVKTAENAIGSTLLDAAQNYVKQYLQGLTAPAAKKSSGGGSSSGSGGGGGYSYPGNYA